MSGPEIDVIDTGLAGAAETIAMTGVLADLHRHGLIGDTLRFCRYRRSVLLGRNQTMDAVDAQACARAGVAIARRLSGGGAVAMDDGVLTWDLVVARRTIPDLEQASAMVGTALVAVLADLGVDAAFHPPGDVRVGGRKISGASGFFDGDTLLHQGTVLVAPDLAGFAGWLGLDADAAAASMTTLAAQPGATPDHSAVADAFATRLAQAMGYRPRRRAVHPSAAAMVRERLASHDGEPPFLAEDGRRVADTAGAAA